MWTNLTDIKERCSYYIMSHIHQQQNLQSYSSSVDLSNTEHT